jgi:hypothetical protein
MPQENESLVITPSEDAPSADRHLAPEIDAGRLISSAALIGAGVLVEPELLGGALLGAGILYGLPLVGQVLRPVVTTAVRFGYSAAASINEIVTGASQQVQGIVAEARAGYPRSHSSRV